MHVDEKAAPACGAGVVASASADANFWFTPHNGGVCCSWRGQITYAQLRHGLEQLGVQPDFEHWRFVIFNLQDARLPAGHGAESDAFWAYALGAQYTNPRLLVCVVSPQRRLLALARRTAPALPAWRTRLFTEIGAARAYVAGKFA